jgi:hypothetical protein
LKSLYADRRWLQLPGSEAAKTARQSCRTAAESRHGDALCRYAPMC